MNRNFFRKHYPAYVISLARTPVRLARFRAWNDPVDLDIELFEAVDGAEFRFETIDPAILVPGTATYSLRTVGVALSHRALWEKCAGGARPLMIFEDDVALRRDLRSSLPPLLECLPKDWDLFLLGYNNNAPFEVSLAADLNVRLDFTVRAPQERDLMRFIGGTLPVGMAPVNCYFGNCAYMISPKGAQQLLKLCFPLDRRLVHIPGMSVPLLAKSFDARINSHLRVIKAFACVPPLAMPLNVTSP